MVKSKYDLSPRSSLIVNHQFPPSSIKASGAEQALKRIEAAKSARLAQLHGADRYSWLQVDPHLPSINDIGGTLARQEARNNAYAPAPPHSASDHANPSITPTHEHEAMCTMDASYCQLISNATHIGPSSLDHIGGEAFIDANPGMRELININRHAPPAKSPTEYYGIMQEFDQYKSFLENDQPGASSDCVLGKTNGGRLIDDWDPIPDLHLDDPFVYEGTAMNLTREPRTPEPVHRSPGHMESDVCPEAPTTNSGQPDSPSDPDGVFARLCAEWTTGSEDNETSFARCTSRPRCI